MQKPSSANLDLCYTDCNATVFDSMILPLVCTAPYLLQVISPWVLNLNFNRLLSDLCLAATVLQLELLTSLWSRV